MTDGNITVSLVRSVLELAPSQLLYIDVFVGVAVTVFIGSFIYRRFRPNEAGKEGASEEEGGERAVVDIDGMLRVVMARRRGDPRGCVRDAYLTLRSVLLSYLSITFRPYLTERELLQLILEKIPKSSPVREALLRAYEVYEETRFSRDSPKVDVDRYARDLASIYKALTGGGARGR